MQKMSNDIELARYQKRAEDLEVAYKAQGERLALLEESFTYERFGSELLALQGQGYDLNPAEELEICKKRRYSKAQLDDKIEDIKRYSKRIPVNAEPLQVAPPALDKAVDETMAHKAVVIASQQNISFDEALAKIRN